MDELKNNLNDLIKMGGLKANINNQPHTFILNRENGNIELKGIGSIWDDNNMLKANIPPKIVEFWRSLNEFVDLKLNGVEFTDIWELVANANINKENENKLKFATDYLNLDTNMIKTAQKLENMSLDGELNFTDDEIDTMTYEKAQMLIGEVAPNRDDISISSSDVSFNDDLGR